MENRRQKSSYTFVYRLVARSLGGIPISGVCPKKLRVFHVLFLVNVQFCVRVSASSFQTLTRKSGGVRALGNIVF